MARRPRIGGGRLWRDAHEGGPVVAAPEVPLQLAGLKAWWDSRTTAQMNASPETGVSSWTSRDGSMGPVALSQATPGNRPIYVASAPQLGGHPGVLFDGDDSLSALTAVDWTFLHDGSGATVFMWLRIDPAGAPLQVIFASTGAVATSATGVYVNSTSGTSFLERIANGGGVAYTNNWSPSDVSLVSRGIPKWFSWAYSTGTQRSAASGVSVSNADTGPAPSLSPSSAPLRIGGVAAGGTLKAHIAQILTYDRVLSTAEINSLGTFFESQYPEVPQQIAGLKCWFDSRTSAQMDIVTGAVQNWRSRAGSMGTSLALTQPTSASRPAYVSSVATLGNRPGVQFDGVDDFLDALFVSDWPFLHNNAGCTVFVVERMDSTGGANQQVLGTASFSSTDVGMSDYFISTTQAYFRVCNGSASLQNALQSGNAAFTTRDVTRWRATTYGGGVKTVYASGVNVPNADVAGQTPSSAPPTIALRIGRPTAAANYFKGFLPQILIYDRVLSAAEVASLGAWAAMEYGVAA